MNDDLASLTNDIISIARKASHVILEVYALNNINLEYKQDKSPVTLADTRASLVIMTELMQLTPDIPIICEESDIPDYDIRKNWSEFWLVDPLDGTKEFIVKNGEFTVNIALIRNNRPILGVVAIPVMNLIYYSYKSGGAFRLESQISYKLTCDKLDLSSGLILVGSRSHMNERTLEFAKLYDIKQYNYIGSTIKFMYLAENKANIYPRLIPCMEWDTAAADIILEEAGGSIWELNQNFEKINKLKYNKKDLTTPDFVAFSCDFV